MRGVKTALDDHESLGAVFFLASAQARAMRLWLVGSTRCGSPNQGDHARPPAPETGLRLASGRVVITTRKPINMMIAPSSSLR